MADLDRERADWERWTREVAALLAEHPRRLLRGYRATAVESHGSGRGWGEVIVTLARGDETLRLYVVPRLALREAFRFTESLAVSHGEETRAVTNEQERVIDVFARALERYAAARQREAAGDDAGGSEGAA